MTEKKIDHKSRAHAVLSASSSARWLACPPSAVAATAYKNQDTAFTREGTLAHEVAEQIARHGLCAESEEYTTEMRTHAYAYREYIEEQITVAEPLIMYEQRVDFSPWVPDGFGTADCIIIQGQTMDVIDYKYGKGVEVSAEHNPQMQLYGLGALNDYGFAYDIRMIRLHIFQPRLGNISVFELTTDELMSWSEHVKIIAEMAAKGEGEYNPGDHCRFCPHAGRCRALNTLCREYVNTHGMKVKVPVLAPFEVAEVLRMEPLVSIWLKRVKEQAIETMMNGGEVPGYKVVEGRSTRGWADEMEAYKALIANGCSRDEITETKLLSPAAMEKAFGKKRAAELLDIGGVERKPGSPTIALESDKRRDYSVANDFAKLN
jgi:hypothetical protein